MLDWVKQGKTKEAIQIPLPHELTHMIQNKIHGEQALTTVLDWALTEGFASYVSYRYWDEKFSPGACLLFSEQDDKCCVEHEQEIKAKVKEVLFSRDQKDIMRLTKGDSPFQEGWPSRLAYFVGFKICEAYDQKHGRDSWKQIYPMSSKKVLADSGYIH